MIFPVGSQGAASAGGALLWRIGTILALLTALSEAAFGRDPVTVVVLSPPQLSASKDEAAAVDLFCDQLAAELAKDAELRVVDRTQIDRVLAEQLGEARPETAARYVTEMIVRRRQAEAEFEAAFPREGPRDKPDLQRVAAAAKLDRHSGLSLDRPLGQGTDPPTSVPRRKCRPCPTHSIPPKASAASADSQNGPPDLGSSSRPERIDPLCWIVRPCSG
jgi:hypothetical protein